MNFPYHYCIGALLLVLILIIFKIATVKWYSNFTIARTEDVVSTVDGQSYRVHLTHDNFAGAANTMAILNRRVTALLRHLRFRYFKGPDSIANGDAYPDRRATVARLLSRYNPDNLAENSPMDPQGDTAYTIDKGSVLAICLRTKSQSDLKEEVSCEGALKNGTKDCAPLIRAVAHSIHNIDILTFVTFHELAHIAIEEHDHPKRFWQAFKFILQEARLAGILLGTNYTKVPERYCGMDVDYNPLYDKALRAIQ
jgi:hypothetical protein